MPFINCDHCGNEIHEDEARYAFDNRLCEGCFDESYDYCIRCDRTIALDDGNYYTDDDGDRVCERCWRNQEDEFYPDNPEINDSDRAVIIKLAKQFVDTVGVKDTYKLKTKPGDFRMKEIEEAVGMLPKPIYLFGIKDDKSYRILASADIIDLVKNYFMDKQHIVDPWAIVLNKGYMRLGLDRALREIHFDKCVELIKYIVSNKQKMKKINVRRDRAHTSDPLVPERVPPPYTYTGASVADVLSVTHDIPEYVPPSPERLQMMRDELLNLIQRDERS